MLMRVSMLPGFGTCGTCSMLPGIDELAPMPACAGTLAPHVLIMLMIGQHRYQWYDHLKERSVPMLHSLGSQGRCLKVNVESCT